MFGVEGDYLWASLKSQTSLCHAFVSQPVGHTNCKIRRIEDFKHEQRVEAQKRIEQVGAEMREVGQKLRKDSQAYQLEHEKLRSSLQPLEELGQKINQASQPMKALGEEMNQLGKQMNALAVQAEKQVRDLIQQAKQKGLVLGVKDI